MDGGPRPITPALMKVGLVLWFRTPNIRQGFDANAHSHHDGVFETASVNIGVCPGAQQPCRPTRGKRKPLMPTPGFISATVLTLQTMPCCNALACSSVGCRESRVQKRTRADSRGSRRKLALHVCIISNVGIWQTRQVQLDSTGGCLDAQPQR
ncbi:hypothetical protein BT67DRAFT_443270 [Trichocladium antarcticum]|uniref:Uncharacterized protein n=1 Tax=Trichocladium antarcticum TaxID=1450529 RepID=A0AAN6UJM9_9PEZI|nr:hypothetical protein BT67DRAFT_443270 [Trichocladium antarcticum]